MWTKSEYGVRGEFRGDSYLYSFDSGLSFGMDHINNIKAKDLNMMLSYYFGSEKLKGILNKVELLEAVTQLFVKDWEGILKM